MRDVEIVFGLFYKDCATFLGWLGRACVVGWNQLAEIAYAGEIVELAETYVEIQSILFINSLQEPSIGVPTLLEICPGVLPVDVSREPIRHGLDEIDLIVQILLQSGFYWCIVQFKFVQIYIGGLYFSIGGVALKESCSSVLIDERL